MTAVLVHLLEYVDGNGSAAAGSVVLSADEIELAGSVVLSADEIDIVRHALADAQAWREPDLGRCRSCEVSCCGECIDHQTDAQLSAAYARLAGELG